MKISKVEIHYLDQSYLNLPIKIIRNNSIFAVFFRQTLKDVEQFSSDTAGFFMPYEEGE